MELGLEMGLEVEVELELEVEVELEEEMEEELCFANKMYWHNTVYYKIATFCYSVWVERIYHKLEKPDLVLVNRKCMLKMNLNGL